MAHRNRESPSQLRSTNPTSTTRDPASEQIMTITEPDAEIGTPPEDAAQQSTTQASTNDKIQSLWQRALDDPNWLPHERNALEKVRAQLQPTTKTIEVTEAFVDIMKDVLEKRQGKDWRIKFRGVDIGIRDVGRKIIGWVDKFKEIGDIIVQFDPVHAALPWAGFRFLVKICVEKQKMVEGFLIGLERLTLLIDRCTIYEFHYLNLGTDPSKQLEKHIVHLYTAILGFVVNAIDHVEDNHLQAVFTTDDVSEHLRKVQVIEKTVEEYARIVENQNTRGNFEHVKGFLRELAELNSSIQVQLNAIQQHLEKSKKSKILKWISDIPYCKHHGQISNERLLGTGEWIFRRQEYSDWKDSGTSKLLLFRGIPGAGKTYTASAVIDSFLKTTERLGYFYCNRAEDARRDPQKILSAIIKQLSQTGSEEGLLTPVVKIYEDQETKGQESAELSLQESKELLVQLADLYPDHETIICIDAMDEVNNLSRLDLLKALKDVIDRSKSVIKIFITTRMDRDILKQFEIFPLIELHPEDNATDINHFITIKVHSIFEEKNWLKEDVGDKLGSEICSILETRCKGNFQLASLQIEFLRQLEIKDDIRGELQRLPETLAKTYDEIYEKIRTKPGSCARLALNAFRWIQCSHMQLKSDELLDVVNADVSSTGRIPTQFETGRFYKRSETFESCSKTMSTNEYSLVSVCIFSLYQLLPAVIESNMDTGTGVGQSTLDMLLLTSSEYGDLEITRMLIEKGADVSATDADGDTPLHLASRSGHKDVAQLLIDNGASVSATNATGDTPLHRASLGGHKDVAKLLIETGASVSATNANGDTPLHEATWDGDWSGLEDVAQLLIENGANVTATNAKGDTPLHVASWTGLENVAKLLIDNGASVSATNANGDTPLHEASWDVDSKGLKDVAKLLIENGANVTATNAIGDTPLHVASWTGYKDVAKLLIDNGASVSATNANGDTPLYEASWTGHKDVAQLLIEEGASVSDTNADGDTPLHRASSEGHMDVAQLLIENGASVCATNATDDTPLHLASSEGHKDVAQLLIEYGATPRNR